jgi:hypothetical protein
MVGGHSGTRISGNAIGGCKPLPCKVEWYLNSRQDPIQYIAWPPNVISTVPAGSVEANGFAYIWMMNVVQWGGTGQTHAWSMLLRGTPTPANFVASPTCYFEVDSKFVNAGLVMTPQGDEIYVFGTGLYRVSDVYLAVIKPSIIEDKSQWRYFTGMSGGNPTWSSSEAAGVSLINGTVAGEISAIYSTYLKQYVITAFNYAGIATLYLYRSNTPFGPWTRTLLFEETLPYSWKTAAMSGAYGGYMVPDQGVNTPILWMTLSFWNPYRTYMVSTDLSKLNTNDPLQILTSATDMKTGVTYDKNHPNTEADLFIDLSIKADIVNRTRINTIM